MLHDSNIGNYNTGQSLEPASSPAVPRTALSSSYHQFRQIFAIASGIGVKPYCHRAHLDFNFELFGKWADSVAVLADGLLLGSERYRSIPRFASLLVIAALLT